VLWLVDASRSVGAEGLDAAVKFIAEADKDGKISSQSHAAFAGQAALFAGSEALQKLTASKLDDTRTDLAQALGFANANFPPGFNKTVVLFSDGVATAGDLPAQAAALRARGVRVHTVPVRQPDRPEALVRAVTAPRTVAEG